MCIKCMNDEDIYDHVFKQRMFIKTKDPKYQEENIYYSHGPLIDYNNKILNVIEYENWSNDKLRVYLMWYFEKSDILFLNIKNMLDDYKEYLRNNNSSMLNNFILISNDLYKIYSSVIENKKRNLDGNQTIIQTIFNKIYQLSIG